MDLAAGLSPATPRSKRGMIYLSPREDENGPPAGTCTRTSAFAEPCDRFFTTGRKWSPPPESHRPVPVYKTGASLPTPGGPWSPRRVTLPDRALIQRDSAYKADGSL